MIRALPSPRPWSALDGRGYGQLNGRAIRASNGLILAVAIGDVPEIPVEANARLIAAAPELLATLKSLLTLDERVCHEDCYGYADLMQDNQAWDVARAAIAQAMGAAS